MPRIPQLSETGTMRSSQLIKGVAGEIHHLKVSWSGATAGQVIAYFLDATSDTSGDPATHEIVIVADAAAGNVVIPYQQGKQFETGIYYKDAELGTVLAEATFK